MASAWKRIVLGASVVVLIACPAAWAGDLVDADASSEILLGCNGPTCTSGSTNATWEPSSEALNTTTVRFGLNVNADDSEGPGLVLESGIARYTLDFTVDGGNYDVLITAFRTGALRRNADAPGCEGSVSLGEILAPKLTINGAAAPDLSSITFPGAMLANGGGDADLEIGGPTQGQTLHMRNRLGDDHFSLTFAMSATAVSDSCEVSARLGAPNGGTTGCSACEYPGDGNRDIKLDGLFVTVTVENLCGDGVLQLPEQCDLGDRNGDSDTCCLLDCTFKSNDRICRSSTSSGVCDPAELCTGSDPLCPPDVKAPAETACEDDGDPCTVDQCDGSGQCVHTDTACPPTATPTPTSIGAASATPVVTPTITPTKGISTPHAGVLALQPTRELLIEEIFDGDGDRFETSAGGSVHGTLDLDANGDLRFTSADLLRLPRCEADAILVGGVCVDKYEASVWSDPPGTSMGSQYGLSGDDYPCAKDGQDCHGRIYARSLAGVVPSANITWFQAQQACANVGKRLPTNAEWQRAAAGTPDTGGADDGSTTCVTAAGAVQASGSRSGCVSRWGTYDMVGNVGEWVAEWMPTSDSCPGWGSFSDDEMCLAGTDRSASFPAALIRGGRAGSGAAAGPLAIAANAFGPDSSAGVVGFRCVRRPF